MNCKLLIGLSTMVLCMVSAQAADNSHAKTIRFFSSQGVPADGSTIPGSSSKLTRYDDSVSIRVNTTRLPEGAYTTWWVIFNDPSECSDVPVPGCDGSDLGIEAVNATVFFATGGLVGRNGVGKFRAHLDEGEIPSGQGQVALPNGGQGMVDASEAEVHMVIKYHGLADPSIVARQTNTIYGGCMGGPGQPPDPIDAYQLFPCYDPQATALPKP